MGIYIQGGWILDPSRNIFQKDDIYIKDGRIQERPEHLSQDDQVIAAEGCWIMPGFVDLHVHLRDPGLTHKETVETGSKAAAAGGFTTICAMPNTKPVTDCPEVINYVLEESRKAPYAHVLPIGAITVGQEGRTLTDQAAMQAAGACAVSEDGKSVADEDLMRQAMLIAKELQMPILDHCEEPVLAGAGDSRGAEDVMTAREIRLAEETGAKLHICHVSTRYSANLVREARAKGLPVTAEVCPHHFALTDEELAKGDSNYKMNPPLRSADDAAAMKEALADGTITCIATDHAPHHVSEKGPMATAANGIIGLETAFALSYTCLVEEGVISPMELARALSYAPAQVLGIPAGTLARGATADVVIVDPKEVWTVDHAKQYSKSQNSPYHGMTLRGKIKTTILAGRMVYNNGQIL